MASSRVAVSLDGAQVAAALAVVDGVVASLARGVVSALPQRVPAQQGALDDAHHLVIMTAKVQASYFNNLNCFRRRKRRCTHAGCRTCFQVACLSSSPSREGAGPVAGRHWLAQVSLGVSAIRVVHPGSRAAQSDAMGSNECTGLTVDQPLLSCPSLLISASADAGAGPRLVSTFFLGHCYCTCYERQLENRVSHASQAAVTVGVRVCTYACSLHPARSSMPLYLTRSPHPLRSSIAPLQADSRCDAA